MVEVPGHQSQCTVYAVLHNTDLSVSDGDSKPSIDLVWCQSAVNLNKHLQHLPDNHEARMNIQILCFDTPPQVDKIDTIVSFKSARFSLVSLAIGMVGKG